MVNMNPQGIKFITLQGIPANMPPPADCVR